MARPSTTKYDPGQLPLLGFVDFVPQGDGTFRPVPRPPVQMASITQAAKASGKSRATIYRLYKNGFIEGDHSSPGKILIDMQSLQAHREACRNSDDFWIEVRKKQAERRKIDQAIQPIQAR